MPRKPRLHYAGALYHVISRGNNRQPTFLHAEDYEQFLALLEKARERKPFRLYAYCLMPNHFHLFMEVGKHPMWVIVQRLLTGYTHYFNRTHRRHGHLFQGRYKAILCDKDNYLLELTRYIHLNPVRAKLVKRPGEWRWSGHGDYLGATKRTLIEPDPVLKRFSKDKSTARKRYTEFVRDGMARGSEPNLYPPEKAPYLGPETFVREQMIRHDEALQRGTPQRPAPAKALMEIAKEAAKGTEVDHWMITGPSRTAAAAEARRRFIRRACQSGHSASDVARFLRRSHAYISRMVNAAE